MYCTKCGFKLESNSKFCTKCGNKIEYDNSDLNVKEGTITFARESSFYGVLVPIRVYVDGKEVASVKSGNQAKVPVSIGKHKIAFDLWSGNNFYDIELNDKYPNVKVNFKLCMGALASEPKIISIEKN